MHPHDKASRSYLFFLRILSFIKYYKRKYNFHSIYNVLLEIYNRYYIFNKQMCGIVDIDVLRRDIKSYKNYLRTLKRIYTSLHDRKLLTDIQYRDIVCLYVQIREQFIIIPKLLKEIVDDSNT